MAYKWLSSVALLIAFIILQGCVGSIPGSIPLSQVDPNAKRVKARVIGFTASRYEIQHYGGTENIMMIPIAGLGLISFPVSTGAVGIPVYEFLVELPDGAQMQIYTEHFFYKGDCVYALVSDRPGYSRLTSTPECPGAMDRTN